MLEAEMRAKRHGHSRMVLTVHPKNTRAVAFYEQLQWVRTLAADGTWAGAMHRDL
jgi:ribosomal protein S18 acetylase RimI-like enzyme